MRVIHRCGNLTLLKDSDMYGVSYSGNEPKIFRSLDWQVKHALRWLQYDNGSGLPSGPIAMARFICEYAGEVQVILVALEMS